MGHSHRPAAAHADLCILGSRCRCWCAECYQPDAVYGGRCVCEQCPANEKASASLLLLKRKQEAPWLGLGWHPTSRGITRRPLWEAEGLCGWCDRIEPLSAEGRLRPHRINILIGGGTCVGGGEEPHPVFEPAMLGAMVDPYEYGRGAPAPVSRRVQQMTTLAEAMNNLGGG